MNSSPSIVRYCNLFLIAFSLLPQIHIANAEVTAYGCSNPSGYERESCTLEELLDGGYFEVEGLRFSNWQFVTSSYSTPAAPDPSRMNIEIFDSASIDDWRGPIGDGPGFRFTHEERSVYGAEYRNFTYSFEVSTLGRNQQLTSNSLLMGGYQSQGHVEGFLEVNELVYDSLDNELGSKNIFADPPFIDNHPRKYTDFVGFSAQTLIYIETQLSETGDSMNDPSNMLLKSYWQRFGYNFIPNQEEFPWELFLPAIHSGANKN